MSTAPLALALLAVLGGDAPSPEPLPPAPRQETPARACGFRFAVYRIRGDISGEASLTVDIRGDPGEKLQAANGPYIFFTKADLTVAASKLVAAERGWTWDGKDQPP